MNSIILRRGFGATLSALVVALLVAGVTGASPAGATDPIPTPFTCAVSTDFYLVGSPAPPALFSSIETSGGPHFGRPVSLSGTTFALNALGFDPGDHFLYAIAQNSTFDLMKIDSTGQVTDVGATNLPGGGSIDYAAGGFDAQGRLWVVGEGAPSNMVAQSIDPAHPTAFTTLHLSAQIPAIDWTYDQGFMWGLNGPELFQVDLTTGQVTTHTVDAVPEESYNAAWTYANGDLGFQETDGETAVRITGVPGGPFAATTTTDTVASSTADGTSCAASVSVGSTLPDATFGSAYSNQLSISGGTSPYTVTQTGGTLPTGLRSPRTARSAAPRQRRAPSPSRCRRRTATA